MVNTTSFGRSSQFRSSELSNALQFNQNEEDCGAAAAGGGDGKDSIDKLGLGDCALRSYN